MLSARAYSFRQKSKLAVSLSWIAGYANVVGARELCEVRYRPRASRIRSSSASFGDFRHARNFHRCGVFEN
jgi:hypothetical protein